MAGYLTVEDKDGNYRVYETPGETWVEIASVGYPDKLAFGEQSIVTASWTADEPTPSGQTIEEAAAEAEAAAAAPEEETATKGKSSEEEPATKSRSR
jgi:hypothetical protein